MGEDQPETGRRLTIDQAADYLGISPDAVRSRVKRGTLAHEREDGRVYVLVDTDRPRPAHDRPPTGQSADNALTSQMQGEIDHLRGQLEAERAAHAEARRIIAGLVERIPAIEAPQEPTGSPQSPQDATEGVEPRPDVPSAEGGTPAAPAKTSTRTVAEGVSIAVFSAAVVALAAKVLVPLVLTVVALVVAGVSALNGQFYVSLASGIVGILSALLSYYLGRRQVQREQERAVEEFGRFFDMSREDLQREPPSNGHRN